MGYTRCPAYLLNTSNSFCSTSRLRFSRSVGGENRGEIFDGDCPLSHNNGCDFALILWLCLHELPPISKIFDSRKGRHLLQCRPLACPYFGTKCPKLHGDYVGNASRPFPAPVLPSHIPPEKRTEKRDDLMGIIQKICPGCFRPQRCPLIYHQKSKANGDGKHIFF